MSTSREKKKMSLKSKRWTSLLILMLFVLSAVLPLASITHASDAVDLSLIVSLSGYSDISILGMRDGATQGFDTAWDNLDPPPPFTGVVSYFWYPDNPTTPVDFRKLSISRISWSDTMSWTYLIKPIGVPIGDPEQAIISWDEAEINLIPPNYPILLLDSEGAVVADMRTVFEYNFVAEDGTTYEFTIQIPRIISISVEPGDIDFGPIYEGGSGTDTVTITTTGNTAAKITATLSDEVPEIFYTTNLKLDSSPVIGWSIQSLSPNTPTDVVLSLEIPSGIEPGFKTAILTFWAETP